METILEKMDTSQLQSRLALLHKYFDEKDIEHTKKIQQLVEKLEKREYVIGFCGHFSAGKSSMMNVLMKEELLPASPIPTSANVVKVKKGPAYARVFYRQDEPVEFKAPYDYEVVKTYCKDGDAILSLEISKPDIDLQTGITIMDTPGIDSTDDAHRLATESALHVADLIFYVMDYNHVQSEQNFVFTKMLKERHKPVYLVINQIDKHNEAELSFREFRDSVSRAFTDWNVEVDGVFFTSLKQKNHPHNQLSELEQFLKTQMDRKNDRVPESVFHSTQQIIHDHVQWMAKQQEQEKQKYEQVLAHLNESEIEHLNEDVEQLHEQLADLAGKEQAFKETFDQDLRKLLDNAYMMPATTRELANNFLEAQDPSFKVGLLFSKKKTEEEKEKRLAAFFTDLQKQIEAQIDWHISDFLTAFLRSYDLEAKSLSNSIHEQKVQISPYFLVQTIKQGAQINGAYLLNYTSDVTNEIKRLYRHQLQSFFEEAFALFQKQLNHIRKRLSEQLDEKQKLATAYESLKAIEREVNRKSRELTGLLEARLPEQMLQNAQTDVQQLLNEKQVFKIKKMEPRDIVQVKDQPEQTRIRTVPDFESETIRDQTQQTAEQLFTSYKLLHELKGLKTISHDLRVKAERLKNQRFTIALFGAFSAGKSSFANALMGENVLPVSPNPTTATINKIVPPSGDAPHGTVKIMMKSEAQLLKDIKGSLQLFGEDCVTLSEAMTKIKKLSSEGAGAKEKPHYTFLKAALAGYESIHHYIGQEVITEMKDFQEYVANEQKACFVESIELYYDCSLTQQGITLVDTPGADSINARHTGVAFEYIKNADAILFVTYYNHAFSKADREFLIQLGRVKETFEMDKMFFIVNAADLAGSHEELQSVVTYIDEQLLGYGIRQPRIYPISSKLALQGKQTNNDQLLTEAKITTFEADFHRFVVGELTSMAVAAAKEGIKHAARMLDDLITAAAQSKEDKQRKFNQAKQTKTELLPVIEQFDGHRQERAIEKEIDELLFYVNQRVFLRYNELFNEAFNPSSLREDGRDLKEALLGCADELIQSVSFDLHQEMRATALRVEKFLNHSLQTVHGLLSEDVTRFVAQLHMLPFEGRTFATLDFKEELLVDQDQIKKRLATFKNAKTFFEQGGKKVMQESLKESLAQPVQTYSSGLNQQMKQAYLQMFQDEVETLKENMTAHVSDYFEGVFSALQENYDITALKQKLEKMQSFLS